MHNNLTSLRATDNLNKPWTVRTKLSLLDEIARLRKPPLLICDKYGWPVEQIKGRPITNLIRLLLHGRKLRRWKPGPTTTDTNDCCGQQQDAEDKEDRAARSAMDLENFLQRGPD